MGATAMRALAELRSRWRAWVAVSVLMGLFFGPLLAAFAGARRTASAYPRFLESQRAWDTVLLDIRFIVSDPDLFWEPDYAALAALPYVEISDRVVIGELGGLTYTGSPDDRYGVELNKARVVEGRLPDPARADEIAVSVLQKGPGAGTRVGSALELHDANGRPLRLQVVGRVVSPFDLPPNEFKPTAIVSSAFLRTVVLNGEQGFAFDGIALRFRERGDLDRFAGDVRRMTGGKAVNPLEQRINAEGVREAANLLVIAMALLAAFGALAAGLILMQTVGRYSTIESEDFRVLGALGMSRGQLAGVGAIRGAAIGGAGVVLAALFALGLSPFFPTGIFRLVETSPGIRFDLLAHVAVPAGLLLLTIGTGVLASVRMARGALEPRTARPAKPAEAAARVGMAASVVAGMRLAFERGRGRAAVPVRSTLATVALGTAALVTALILSHDIGRLLDTPSLYGKRWDTIVGFSEGRPLTKELLDAIAAEPGIEAAAVADTGAPLRVENARVGGFFLGPVKGSMFPYILEGREPRTENEIVLGTRTLHEMGKTFDPEHPLEVVVRIEGQQEPLGTAVVVGRAVIPPTDNFTGFGRGLMALQVYGDDIENAPDLTDCLVRFAPGADRKKIIASLAARFPGVADGGPLVGRPVDIVNFGRVSGAPVILAVLFAVMGGAALAHALVTAVRRRTRDLAILKTLGFVRRQVRTTVAVQASAIVAAAMIFAIPLGIAAGKTLWRALADQIGVVPDAAIPLLPVALVVPGALLLANLLGALPGRAAARTQPAIILRAE